MALTALAAAIAGGCRGDSNRAPPRVEGGLHPLPTVEVGDLAVSTVVVPAPVTPDRAALYLDVRNGGAEPDTLVQVDVGDLGSAGLHETSHTDGIVRMRPRGPVPVAERSTVRFRPGGLHVMIEGLRRAPEAGDTVPVEIRFSRAGAVEVRALVVPYADLEAVLGSGG